MKQILIITNLIIIYSQQIKIGEKCQCAQLLIQNDCQKIPQCYWDNQLLQCKTSIDVYSQKYLLENINEIKENKAFSFFCNQMTQEQCRKETSCIYFKEQCSHFTGCTAYLRETHEDCQRLSSLCISDSEMCVNIDNCNTYKNSYSCYFDKQGKFCNWNKEKRLCESIQQCDQLPLKLKSHQECQNQLDKCTTKKGGGCIELTYQCNDLKEEESCYINSGKNKDCFWNDNKCLERTCDNASITLRSDEECKQFLQECTTKKGGGCVQRSNCQDAQVQEACVVNQYGEGCFWDGVKCMNILCENAPSSYTTYEQCQSIHKICITNGNGCISNYGCEFATTEQFCYKDGEDNECIWRNNHCTRKQCQHAGDNYFGYEQCQQFMFQCTGNNDKSGCVEKSCQNAPIQFSTNQECESYLPNNQCITKKGGGCRKNVICVYIDTEEACKIDTLGSTCFWNYQENKCQKITTCSSILNQKDCIKDNNNQPCDWIQSNKCVQKTCDTAPLQLLTEKQCQEYFNDMNGTICTSKLNGGCKMKSSCQNQQTQESCNMDIKGNQCFWNDTLKQCKLKECNDIHSNSFQECYSFNNNCTIGLNGYCVQLRMCNQINSKYECIFGQDGPCLWIDNYTSNGGKCFQYNSCQSMKWKTDRECKLISNYCTTNGYECVPITRCQETNINGGCVTGIEGMCIQSVTALGILEQPKCQIFLHCSQAFYLTHLECQKANPQCTTNGITGCRSLTSCDYYIEEACHFNNVGIERNERNQVISTGNCVWDSQYNICRNEDCKDMKFNTKEECQNALQSCTSDGQKCISKMMCADYHNKDLCNYALGMEGSCIWKQQHCQQKTCSDIISQCEEVDNCISDGIKCIPKRNCSEYKNQVSCNSIGLDGLCYWDSTINQCHLMNGCSSANHDQIACQQANDRCYWQPQNQNQPSQCKEHTCSSYENQSGECSHYLTWDWQSYNICRFVSFQCMNFDVKSLTEHTCLLYSLELYKWNPISSACTECDTGETNQDANRSPIPQGQGIAEILISKILSAIVIIIQMIV
ncbi:unnamed protein product [Paramecium primaurelia]|uniref:Uncharacterized protein n=1 Tax=Paramecium primaurelia TaxID=5886 RepID=A0A8S1QIR9_PARPR|nr:unnamed protein product [Paramecium primaurelia]